MKEKNGGMRGPGNAVAVGCECLKYCGHRGGRVVGLSFCSTERTVENKKWLPPPPFQKNSKNFARNQKQLTRVRKYKILLLYYASAPDYPIFLNLRAVFAFLFFFFSKTTNCLFDSTMGKKKNANKGSSSGSASAPAAAAVADETAEQATKADDAPLVMENVPDVEPSSSETTVVVVGDSTDIPAQQAAAEPPPLEEAIATPDEVVPEAIVDQPSVDESAVPPQDESTLSPQDESSRVQSPPPPPRVEYAPAPELGAGVLAMDAIMALSATFSNLHEPALLALEQQLGEIKFGRWRPREFRN